MLYCQMLLNDCQFKFFRILHASYDMNIEQMKNASQSGRNLINSLLKKSPKTRLTAQVKKKCQPSKKRNILLGDVDNYKKI